VILILDLDNTLYPKSSGVFRMIDRRMSRYMVERLGFDAATVDETRVRYWHEFGTTMKGLRETIGIDEEDFLTFVHDIPVDEMIKRDPELESALNAIDAPKYIFTNADTRHAGRVLKALGIENCFRDVIDIRALNLAAKPDPKGYEFVEEKIGLDGDLAVFADDFPMYLEPAKARGWKTVHVWDEAPDEIAAGGKEPYIDFTIRRIHSMPEVIAEIAR
jgi:putative hydrolase of the HAD superfamily